MQVAPRAQVVYNVNNHSTGRTTDQSSSDSVKWLKLWYRLQLDNTSFYYFNFILFDDDDRNTHISILP